MSENFEKHTAEGNFYRSFLRYYYLASFFYDFVFAYAIYNVLFSIRGLSVFQISILLAWWAFIAMVFEIPTGGLADYWSRKKLLVIAPIVKSLCFVVWFFANGNFYLYALGFVFWALGSSLISGTTEAILYDTLVHYQKGDEYERVLGKKKFYFNIALAISAITGGIIASYKIDWAIIFSVAPLLLSAFFASRITEVPKVKSTEEIHYLKYIRLAFKEIKANKILLYLFVYLFCISIFGYLEEFDQLYYQLAKLPLYAFGFVGFFWSLFNSVGSYYAYKFKGKPVILWISPIISAVCLIFVSRYPSIPIIGLLLLAYFIASPLKVLAESSIPWQVPQNSDTFSTSLNNV